MNKKQRQDAERIAGNVRFIAERTDAELMTVDQDYYLDERTRAEVEAERTRRGL